MSQALPSNESEEVDLDSNKSVENRSGSNENGSYLLPDGKIDWEGALCDNEKWMRSSIARHVGEQAAVDEVFQNVALAATRQKAPLRDPGKIVAWLRRLVVLQSLLYRRTMGRKRKLQKRYEENFTLSDSDELQLDPLDWLAHKERNEFVRKALQLISQDDREILLLKYAEDLSYQEISQRTAATVSAVQSRLRRARLRLKKQLVSLVSDHD